MKDAFVWYASYGSNLSRDRFLCYILGETPKGSSQKEVGCRDKTLPRKDKPIRIPHPLYFSMHAAKWDHGGVAFLDASQSEASTLGRMYLITREQFIDVVKQENTIHTDFTLHFEDIMNQPKGVDVLDTWYGKILHIGEEEGYPIFTFTAPWRYKDVKPSRPSKSYLSTLILGYKETYSMQTMDIVDYLITKPGIFETYTFDELVELIDSI